MRVDACVYLIIPSQKTCTTDTLIRGCDRTPRQVYIVKIWEIRSHPIPVRILGIIGVYLYKLRIPIEFKKTSLLITKILPNNYCFLLWQVLSQSVTSDDDLGILKTSTKRLYCTDAYTPFVVKTRIFTPNNRYPLREKIQPKLFDDQTAVV